MTRYEKETGTKFDYYFQAHFGRIHEELELSLQQEWRAAKVGELHAIYKILPEDFDNSFLVRDCYLERNRINTVHVKKVKVGVVFIHYYIR